MRMGMLRAVAISKRCRPLLVSSVLSLAGLSIQQRRLKHRMSEGIVNRVRQAVAMGPCEVISASPAVDVLEAVVAVHRQ